MIRPLLPFLVAFITLWQAMVGVPLAVAASVDPTMAMCRNGPAPAPVGDNGRHDHVSCPLCCAVAHAPSLVPALPVVPRSSRVAAVVAAPASLAAPAPARTPPTRSRDPPRPA